MKEEDLSFHKQTSFLFFSTDYFHRPNYKVAGAEKEVLS